MAFLESFADPQSEQSRVLDALGKLSGRIAEGFARDPSVRTQQKIARLKREDAEREAEDLRISRGLSGLQKMGGFITALVKDGNKIPPGLMKAIRISGKNLGPAGEDLAEQIALIGQIKFEADIVDPESPIGKLQFDRATAVERFGEGSPQVRQIDAVIGQATTEAVQPLNLIFPDGRKVGFDKVTQKDEIITAFEQGAVPVGLSVQAGDLAGLGLPGKKESREAGEEARALAGGIAQASETLKDLENNVKASGGGLRGLAIDKIGGFLGQIDNGLEAGFAELLGDASPAEVKRFRFRSRAVVAGMLSSITGEQSGRFTEQERAIATEALGALDASSSFEQMRAGLATALEIMVLSQDRNAIISGVLSAEDLTTREGINAMGQRLLDLGMQRDQAEEVLLRLIRQRKELARTTAR